jgi:site-specific recombinase XerD
MATVSGSGPSRETPQKLRSPPERGPTGSRDPPALSPPGTAGRREVVHLCLEDLDWSAGELRLRGKGARLDRLPLPHDVGRAMADYLKTRQTGEACRRVFLRSSAPYTGLASSCTVAGVVRRALARADLHPHHQGAHLLRHSLATRMLRGGASLAQIAQVLRHQQAQSTEIYAKVDLKALRLLAQPWPGGVR